jgi:hypothetical protein
MIFCQITLNIEVLYSQKITEKYPKKRLIGPKLCESGPEIAGQNTLLNIDTKYPGRNAQKK